MEKIIELLTSNRFKSLYWSSFWMFMAALIAMISDSLAGLGLNSEVTVFLGLVLNQISKEISKRYATK
jgi:hypothetical protein